MPRRMLIDAAHAEETRVVVLNGKRLEEFDFESSTKKQLKGNIYLAKVTRVEPSLQAAFIDYGGNRHGFLPFSEIHPDYYQIPVEDRKALITEEAAHAGDDDEPDHANDKDTKGGKDSGGGEDTPVESIGSDDDLEEVRAMRPRPRRYYKIQEVIKRRQILLIQVVKEERGNKGAAMTTYLSLAGRYCVLMPNTARGGGISRKISNPSDRKRLKGLLSSLNVPEGMACILRTAGVKRTKPEIRRDYEYLLRLWDSIRDLTLRSMAPALIYEEGSLIKRAIRDVYTRDIDEILVEGQEGYKAAKKFMRMLMPSHAKKVKNYSDRIPLFHRFQVESQLDSMFSPVVELRSGGYIVINPTEALVAVDVNSGRSTREHNIEETALKTNLEAAEEVARQLRLRDMAGLVVIDFIDMEENRNIRAVEKKLKECLRADRARIQVGRISHFGLLELSRQRLRPGLLEASTGPCHICQGTGIVRSTESSALEVVRAIEEEGIRDRSAAVDIFLPADVALFLLNEKRRYLSDLETRFNMTIRVRADDELVAPKYRMEREARKEGEAEGAETVRPDAAVAPAEAEEVPETKAVEEEEEAEEQKPKRRPRRRKRRSRRPKEEAPASTAESVAEPDAATATDEAEPASEKPKRRRSRRPKKETPVETEATAEADAQSQTTPDEQPVAAEAAPAEGTAGESKGEAARAETEKAKPRRRSPRARRKTPAPAAETAASEAPEAAETPEESETPAMVASPGPVDIPPPPEDSAAGDGDRGPHAGDTATAANANAQPASSQTDDTATEADTEEKSEGPKRRGWWQRRKTSSG